MLFGRHFLAAHHGGVEIQIQILRDVANVRQQITHRCLSAATLRRGIHRDDPPNLTVKIHVYFSYWGLRSRRERPGGFRLSFRT